MTMVVVVVVVVERWNSVCAHRHSIQAHLGAGTTVQNINGLVGWGTTPGKLANWGVLCSSMENLLSSLCYLLWFPSSSFISHYHKIIGFTCKKYDRCVSLSNPSLQNVLRKCILEKFMTRKIHPYFVFVKTCLQEYCGDKRISEGLLFTQSESNPHRNYGENHIIIYLHSQFSLTIFHVFPKM